MLTPPPTHTQLPPPPKKQVRTQTLVKNAIIQIDAAPFKQWYQQHYGIELGQKKGTAEEATEAKVCGCVVVVVVVGYIDLEGLLEGAGGQRGRWSGWGQHVCMERTAGALGCGAQPVSAAAVDECAGLRGQPVSAEEQLAVVQLCWTGGTDAGQAVSTQQPSAACSLTADAGRMVQQHSRLSCAGTAGWLVGVWGVHLSACVRLVPAM